MSLRYLVAAFSARVGNPTRKLVLLKLADNANDEGICWPSAARIAHDTELSRDSVKRHLKLLESDGFISVRRRVKDGVNLPSVYQLVGLANAVERWGYIAPTGGNRSPEMDAAGIQGRCSMHHEPSTDPSTEAARKTASVHASASMNEHKGKVRSVRASGIVTWYPSDPHAAEQIEQQHTADEIGRAVAAIVATTEKDPVPGLVTKEIARQRSKDEAEQRRAEAEAARLARLQAPLPEPDLLARERGRSLLPEALRIHVNPNPEISNA